MPNSVTPSAAALAATLAAAPALAQFPYGTGTPGSGGITPQIDCNQPWAGRTDFEIALDQAYGGTAGLLVISFGPDSSTYAGLPLYVDTAAVLATRFLVLGGGSGVPGAGSTATAFPLTGATPAFVGLSLFAQAVLIDPVGPGFGGGWVATGGLEFELTAVPQLFSGTSVSGSTDPFWATNGVTGSIDYSGGNQYTNDVIGAAYTNDGQDLYVSSGSGQLAHADLSSGSPAWSWLNTTIGLTGVAGDNCVIDRDARLLWMIGQANGVAELLAVDIDESSASYGSVIHNTTTLFATVGLIGGLWGMSHDRKIAAVPSLLGRSLHLFDTDPASTTFLRVVQSSPLPVSPIAFPVVTSRIRFSPDDTECYVLLGVGAINELARFRVPAGIWLDHDPSTAIIDNIGPNSSPAVPFGSSAVGLDIAEDGAIYVCGSSGSGSGWAGRVIVNGVTPTWTPLNAISSLGNARHVALNRDQDVLAIAVANPATTVLFFDPQTLAEIGATALTGSNNTATLVWR
ncbi:MAG: hypothetical protein KDE27_11795 [Planctomycetes bacterium]|nr:hypothetical protein [Planctomycetota bacterium]